MERGGEVNNKDKDCSKFALCVLKFRFGMSQNIKERLN